MGPQAYPHRASFLASTLHVPDALAPRAPDLARLVWVIVFDHLVRHPVVTLGDHDDDRLTDEHHHLIDLRHPQASDSIDWLFRVARRHEVLWFELDLTPEARPAVLRARRPHGSGAARAVDVWAAQPELALSHQLDHCLAQWLAARRLPAVGPLPGFTLADLVAAADHLAGTELPPALAVAYLRVVGERSPGDARALDARILGIDPSHPVARRNRYVAELNSGAIDRRAILPLVDEAPMYAKPHLSIWGEAFVHDRPLEGMGVRHQGIAASLAPANPYACHNYSLQLAEHGRREESYRWADRATVVAPQLGAAHLDCVRRLRQVGRPGQAFAEAQYRCREILDRAEAGKLAARDWQAPHHAALLFAFVHLDVGRLGEAIELADAVMANLPADPAARAAFDWAAQRITHWKTDPRLYARAYAWEGHHRGDVGRVLTGLTRGRISDDEDAMMLVDALCTLARAEQAEIVYWQCAGLDGPGVPAASAVLGDGKARLAAAKALLITGDLDEALDQIQIVQLRRGQSRLEAEINRLWRLAAIWPAAEWRGVVARRRARGATTLAQLAARDVADFIPELGADDAFTSALGPRAPLALDPLWVGELIAAVPAAQASSAAIVLRLAVPTDPSLATADALVEDWWTVLVPSARDRDAHAAGAMLALGLALASGPPSPLAGAYRHIATDALHLVRRARYQIEPPAIIALLRTLERLADAPDWLLDTWLLRVERALDLEAEHGAYLDAMIADLPRVQRWLRGDERIGWELRLAHDLAADPSQYEPASALFARAARAVEGGDVVRAWSWAAAAANAPGQLDLHWQAALANPSGVAGPWLRLAHALIAAGRPGDGFEAACRGIAAANPEQRTRALRALAPVWHEIATPLDGDAAFARGVAEAKAARTDDDLLAAIAHLQWAAAIEPASAPRAEALARALCRFGEAHQAIRVLAVHMPSDAPRWVGTALVDAGHDDLAVRVLRYAARRFRAADDWALLAGAAHRTGDDAVAADAARRAIAVGARAPSLAIILATSLYRIGDFVGCEPRAQDLLELDAGRDVQLAGLHAMARALAGQGRHVDAHAYAKAAAELRPTGALAAELAETLACITAQDRPPVRPSLERSKERQACDDLEAGRLDALVASVSAPAWAIARVALAACEVRRDDESGIPVAPRALDAAVTILGRSRGATAPDAVLARIRALRIRDNAFLQIDPPPPLGPRCSPDEFERAYAERAGDSA